MFEQRKISVPNLKKNGNKFNVLPKQTNLNLLEDNMGEMELIDTRKYISNLCTDNKENNDEKNKIILEELPEKITGTYNLDYNILYIDEIIRKKIQQEKYSHINNLKHNYKTLTESSKNPQTYVVREKTLESMNKIKKEIEDIESGEKLRKYESLTNKIITQYKAYSGKTKTISFSINTDNEYPLMDDDLRYRISLIDSFLDIAKDYIYIDIIRINNIPSDICTGCGTSLTKVAVSEEGTIRCPNEDCNTEHDMIILTKLAKDGSRINTNNNTDDESIDNFLRAFIRYQGLQSELSDNDLYQDLDNYFIKHDRPCGDDIKKLPLNNRGRRGDTNHKMLWTALSHIGRSEYYEDANLIGHKYWGWTLPDVMHLKEIIISHYNKTQKVFYQIPPEERCRNSSLGTQYRLWRHLQLVGHECYMDEFKIAENSESLRTHNKLWRLMCEGCNDPDITYIS